MIQRRVGWAGVVLAALTMSACAGGQSLDLEVKARLDGRAVAQAKVMVDGEEQGLTDGAGVFTKRLTRKPGAEVELRVVTEQPGYRVQPWKTTFLVKLPKGQAVEKYSFDADLQATRYVTLVVTEKGGPLAEASVKVNGREVGQTDARGEFVYEYSDSPKGGLDLTVGKAGYSTWRRPGRLEPGQRLEAALSRRVILRVTALTEEYGQSSGLAGATVSIEGRPVGKTDDRGAYTYTYDGEPGRRVQVALSLPDYIPSDWKTSVALEGQVTVQRYFYPATPRPIRVGIYGFVGNTPGADLKEIVDRTERAVGAQLFKHTVFREVPAADLKSEVKRLKLGIDRITVKGWRDTPLRRTVDMLVLGSVAQEGQGFIIEAKFYTASGKLILSQLTRARDDEAITRVAREIAAGVIERFPFEGTVVAAEDQRYRINIGKPYRISRGTELTLTAANLAEGGRVTGYRETGRLSVKRAEESGSLTEVEELKKGERVSVGDRVVRRVHHEGEEGSAGNSLIVSVKGGLAPGGAPLPGVNIYLNSDWVGSTGLDGKAEVPLRLGKTYDLLLYRHGYQQATVKLKAAQNKDVREFLLSANTSLFKVDSDPSGAGVFVDSDEFGRTPLLEGKLVNLGFHTVKLTRGEDYRDWEEVVEFDKKVEDRTGSQRIVLHKDYLRIGERAAQRGDVEGAIQAYASAAKDHPDYSETHHRLAQIYLDEKNDHEGAIRALENVFSLPQNQQLIYKQFAVAFTNLGHAYHEKGSSLAHKDRDAAAQAFAKAIQNLQIARQNTRFFPTEHHDEALHNTHYYLALSYQKLYLLTRKAALAEAANLAWREYFDFFPRKLEGQQAFEQSRETARKHWDQIKDHH